MLSRPDLFFPFQLELLMEKDWILTIRVVVSLHKISKFFLQPFSSQMRLSLSLLKSYNICQDCAINFMTYPHTHLFLENCVYVIFGYHRHINGCLAEMSFNTSFYYHKNMSLYCSQCALGLQYYFLQGCYLTQVLGKNVLTIALILALIYKCFVVALTPIN